MIEVSKNTTTYKALNGRRYLTMRSAADACARFRLEKKYPPEGVEFDCGRMTYPGFHYLETDWGKKLHRRLFKIYMKHYKAISAAA